MGKLSLKGDVLLLVHKLLETGGADKLVFTGKYAITYGELRSTVALYRAFFAAQGVAAGDNVGLLAKNSPEFVYSYMAIASLGAVVVPINYQLVPREIAYIVQDAKMKTFVVMNKYELEDDLQRYGYKQSVNQLVLSDIPSRLGLDAAVPAKEDVDESQPCVIIYTSGTTGNPKGAVLTHRNLVANASAFVSVLPITADDNSLCVLPMYHSFAWTCAILGSLLQGGSITIQESFHPAETVTVIKNGVTVVYGVPAMYNVFAARVSPEDFKAVKLFVSGGASLPEPVAKAFREKFGQPIVEGYGLSEASPVVSVNPVNHVKYGSIGLALPEVKTRIVDDSGNDLAAGEVGELLVQGPNVMKGYYNLPEATVQALQNGWLHTGDMARKDEEGYLYIVDRLKDLIITGGLNVYPREVEELLYAYPGVAEAAVIGVHDRLRGEAPYAFLAVKEGQTIDKAAVKAYLQANLAPFKQPREIAIVDSLPKNSTGKILKRELRERFNTER